MSGKDLKVKVNVNVVMPEVAKIAVIEKLVLKFEEAGILISEIEENDVLIDGYSKSIERIDRAIDKVNKIVLCNEVQYQIRNPENLEIETYDIKAIKDEHLLKLLDELMKLRAGLVNFWGDDLLLGIVEVKISDICNEYMLLGNDILKDLEGAYCMIKSTGIEDEK